MFLAIIHQSFHVNAVRVVQTAADFGDADYFIARLMHEHSGIGANIAEALNDDAGRFAIQAELLAGLIADDHHAAAGGFAASAGATDVDRFSRDDGSDRLAHVHGICVHHPRHDLFVSVDIGGGNVFFRAYEFD